MSKGAGQTRSVSQTGLPDFQQPYVDKMMGEASRLYDSPGPIFFPGSTVADFRPAETLGMNFLQDTAGQQAAFNETQIAPALGTALTAYRVHENPVVQGMVQGATQPIIQNLREQVLPGIKSGAVASGTQGGSRQAMAESMAMERAAQQAMNTGAGIYGQAYGQGLSSLGQALSLAPSLQQSAYTPGMILSGVGEKERSLEQSRIDEAVARHQYEQNLPYQKLMEYANLIKNPFGGQQISEVQAEGGGLGQAIGAGLTGGAALWDLIRRFFPQPTPTPATP